MTDETSKSDVISPRRRLLEEILEARSRVVSALPVDMQDPPPSSALWPIGISRLAMSVPFSSLEHRRRVAVDVAVVALAWLEAIDRELG